MMITAVCEHCGFAIQQWGGRPEAEDDNPAVPRPDEVQAEIDAAMTKHYEEEHALANQ